MVRLPTGQEIFLFSRPVMGPTQPPIHWVPGAMPSRVKRPGRQFDHSPPSSAEVKNEWSHTSTSTRAFVMCGGITLLLMPTVPICEI